MPTLIQTATGRTLSGTSADAVFGSANALNNLIAVAVLWFSRTTTPVGEPSMTVTDTQGNTYGPAYTQYYLGANLKLGVFFVPACLAGSNTIHGNVGTSGVIFVNAHEVQPDAGQVWQFDGAGYGRATATTELVITGNVGAFSNEYTFMCFGVDNQNFLPTVAAPTGVFTNRTYNANSTAIDTGSTTTGGAELFFYGALSTWDGAFTTFGEQLAWVTANVYAAIGIVVNFASVVPHCHPPVATPPAGTYVGTQSVTLAQDQGKPMYYTLDGSTPTTASAPYTGAISITSSKRINVLAHDPSAVLADTIVGLNYTIQPNPPANSNISISWVRRTRVGGAWIDGQGAVPLSEQSESYDLYIMTPDGSAVVRQVLGLTSPTFNYTAAMQFSDFGAYQPYAFVKVFQNSASVGHGFPAINAKVGDGLGWSAGGSGDASSILGNPITGSANDGDILQYRSSTGNWEIVGPALRRQTITKITGSLANNASETGTLPVNCGMFGLILVTVDKACRVQLYSTAAFRDADAGRGYNVLPTAGTQNGILGDFGLDTPGGETFDCSPPLLCANADGSPVQSVYYRITNLSGSTGTITASLKIVPLEIL